MRAFLRNYLFKILLVIIVLQLGVFYWLEQRNHKPVAEKDSAQVIENRSVKMIPLKNDSDEDEDTLSIAEIGEPLHGKAILQDKVVEYLPQKRFVGIDSFWYQASDGKKLSDKTYVTVQVFEDQAPVVKPDYAELYRGSTILVNILGNDTDPENDSLFIAEYTQPQFGVLSKTGNDFEYSHLNNPAAADSFHYIASDGLNTSNKETVHINIKSKNDPCYPWLSQDIGNTNIKGNLQCTGNTFVIKASGHDIWAENDGFHLAYQEISGDWEIRTRIESLENTHEWAKSGIMFRETRDANSRHLLLCMTSQHGVVINFREEKGGASADIRTGNTLTPPCWLKLTRKGNTFSGYASTNGRTWDEIGTYEQDLKRNAYAGLALTSHDNDTVCTAVYDKGATRIVK